MDDGSVESVVHVVSLGDEMGQMVITEAAAFVVPDPSLGSTPDAPPSVVHEVDAMADVARVVGPGQDDMTDPRPF